MIRDIVGSTTWCETKILSHSQSCYLFQVWYTNVLVHAELHMIYAALSKVPRCCQVWWIRVPLVVLYALLNTIYNTMALTVLKASSYSSKSAKKIRMLVVKNCLLFIYSKVKSTNASRFVARLVYMHTQNGNFLIRSSSWI